MRHGIGLFEPITNNQTLALNECYCYTGAVSVRACTAQMTADKA